MQTLQKSTIIQSQPLLVPLPLDISVAQEAVILDNLSKEHPPFNSFFSVFLSRGDVVTCAFFLAIFRANGFEFDLSDVASIRAEDCSHLCAADTAVIDALESSFENQHSGLTSTLEEDKTQGGNERIKHTHAGKC